MTWPAPNPKPCLRVWDVIFYQRSSVVLFQVGPLDLIQALVSEPCPRAEGVVL